ncbi:MAG: deoxynucleoside kinase, partial [Candidatus Aminicenantes bacterium]|nr:deoxynucleoside kinase [Candidatus Aminicenantes bacterium]
MSEFRYLIVDGLIKSGKTRLARILAEEFNARLILDNKENPFLNDYFTEVARHENSLSLKTQLIFLL